VVTAPKTLIGNAIEHHLRRPHLVGREIRESGQGGQGQDCDGTERQGANAEVHDEEGAEGRVHPLLVAARVSVSHLPDEPVTVSEIQELEVGRHRRDEHPQAVLRLAQVMDRERHQEDADRDVDEQQHVAGQRPGEQVPGGALHARLTGPRSTEDGAGTLGAASLPADAWNRMPFSGRLPPPS
jgi:hypothetical protein